MNFTLEQLADLLSEMNSIGEKISAITQRPATIGHTGEYIAAEIFDIELEETANAKGIDGHCSSGTMAGRTVKSLSVLTMIGEDKQKFVMSKPGPDGKMFKKMEIIYTRKK